MHEAPSTWVNQKKLSIISTLFEIVTKSYPLLVIEDVGTWEGLEVLKINISLIHHLLNKVPEKAQNHLIPKPRP